MRKKIAYYLTLLLIFIGISAKAQVTTSSLMGMVSDEHGKALSGCLLIAIHMPSGTQYAVVSNNQGRYVLNGLRSGGPYKLIIDYLNKKHQEYEGLNLLLGQTTILNCQMHDKEIAHDQVVISENKHSNFNTSKTGASTNVGYTDINSLPTINRSITDFTRITPQSNGESFAGQDSRYNNITLDGCNFNNNFGNSDGTLPGGKNQPISLDAIQEISINLANFDVKQSGFTGGNINAITKSGTNDFHASVYGYFRNQNMSGKKIEDVEIDAQDITKRTIGVSLGGPIVKNKLFYFVNFESENESKPGILFKPSSDGVENASLNISRTSTSDLKTMQDFLINTYGYNPGSYNNFDNFDNNNYKIMLRLDYNINKNNTFSIRYNTVNGTTNNELNETSRVGVRSSFARYSSKSIAFNNSNYQNIDKVNTISAELNSKISEKLSNLFLATYSNVEESRDCNSAVFPFVDIEKDGDPYMSFGYEPFAYNNSMINKTLSFIDNLTYSLGKHNLLFGISYEQLGFDNSFFRYGTSYYRFDSMESFINGNAPIAFGYTYAYNNTDNGINKVKFALASAYVQDDFSVSENFRFNYGVRVEMPLYLNDLMANTAIDNQTWLDGYKIESGLWPKSKISVCPRIGFNYNLNQEQTIKLRGGVGIFTGRLPFVWFTNQPGNSGVLTNTIMETKAENLENIKFDKDIEKYKGNYPSNAGNKLPGSVVKVDEDFKMPTILRSNIGADFKLPSNLVLSFDVTHSKDINAILEKDVNLKAPNSKLEGADNRPYYTSDYDKLVVNSLQTNGATILTNNNKGYATQFTFAISREREKGFSASLAYTYSIAKSNSVNPGSTAHSVFENNPQIGYMNDAELSYTSFSLPHRLVGYVQYRKEYGKNFASAINLFYVGSHQARKSFTVSGDLNNDGNNADLMFIPKDKSQINLLDIEDNNGNVIFTADKQWEYLEAYINNDKYLKNHKGEYAERFGALMPWINNWDLKFVQEFYFTQRDERRHTLAFSVDVLNIGNLLNKNWGNLKVQSLGSGDVITPLKVVKVENNIPYYQMNYTAGKLLTESYQTLINQNNTWSLMLGVKYSF